MPTFQRKNIRLPASYYRGQRLYFLTLCFHNRRRIGANARVAAWLIDRMRTIAQNYAFLVHAYCVMPDHLHLLAQGATADSDLMAFIEFFKQDTGFRFEAKTRHRLWQFKSYDHIVRQTESADRIAWYIWMNPVRQALCDSPEAYAFLGSLTNHGQSLLAQHLRPQPWTPPWKKPPLM